MRLIGRLTTGLVLAATGAALALGAGCGSLSKAELRQRLLAVHDDPRLTAAVRTGILPLALGGAGGGRAPRDVEVTWARFGNPGAPSLLLLHGTPGSLTTWAPVLFDGVDDDGTPFAGLTSDHDVTLIELPGHGFSTDGLAPRTFQACADYVAAVCDALQLPPSTVVGQSYGGEIAWRLALDRPDLVSRLVLVDSAGMPRADDEWLPEEVAMREWPGAGFGYLLNARDRIATALEPHFADAPPAAFAEELFLSCDNAVNWQVMVDLAKDENGERAHELQRMQPPVLLVWGGADVAYTVERFAQRFDALIPDSRLVVLDGVGHYPPQEVPGAFCAALRE